MQSAAAQDANLHATPSAFAPAPSAAPAPPAGPQAGMVLAAPSPALPRPPAALAAAASVPASDSPSPPLSVADAAAGSIGADLSPMHRAPESGAPAPADGLLLPAAALRAGGPGYRIQLGVFGDSANALKLHQRLAAEGYPAHIQSRVVVGPFADRAAAEKARQALRQSGLGGGVLVAPERQK